MPRAPQRSEFSAVRSEMKTQGATLRAEILATIHSGDEGTRSEIRRGDEELRAEIRRGDEETRVYMRTLFEKHQADKRLIDEGKPKRSKRR